MKSLVESVRNVPIVRSVIQEFNIKGKLIVPIGESAITLVGQSLGLDLVSNHPQTKENQYKFLYNKKLNILSLPYSQSLLESDPQQLGKLYDGIGSAVVSIKYRVLGKTK